MTDRIEELTRKIYNEGVVKAKDEAGEIIGAAKAKADDIILAAKKEQEKIIQNANKKAEEIRQKNEAEIQLAARQFTSTLKQKITGLITTAQTDKSIKDAFNDIEFIQNMILTILKNWDPTDSGRLDLKVLLPQKEEKRMTAFFDSKARETMNKGVEVSFDSKQKSGFKIGPKDDSYILSFTDEDFENYFKQYFKDSTKELLFHAAEKD